MPEDVEWKHLQNPHWQLVPICSKDCSEKDKAKYGYADGYGHSVVAFCAANAFPKRVTQGIAISATAAQRTLAAFRAHELVSIAFVVG